MDGAAVRDLVAARRALEAGEAAGVTVGHRNVRACLVQDLVSRSVDYYLDDSSVEVETCRRILYEHDTEYLTRPDACDGCGHRAHCPGGASRDLAALRDVGVRAIGRE